MIKNVKQFIREFELPPIALEILRTTEDCQQFIDSYFGRNNYVVFDLLNFKEEQLHKNEIALNEYLEMCKEKGIKYAFENTFHQLFSSQDIDFIETKIAEGITLEEIYYWAKKNPNNNIFKMLL